LPIAPDSALAANPADQWRYFEMETREECDAALRTAAIFEEHLGDFTGPHPVASLLQPVDVPVDSGDGVPDVTANPAMIAHLGGLLTNCLKGMAGEGSAFSVTINVAENNDSVELILDDGLEAWTEVQRAQCFHPYVKGDRNLEGFGHGLVTAYFIIFHHSGKIAIPGDAGAKITVTLPCDPDSGEDLRHNPTIATFSALPNSHPALAPCRSLTILCSSH
jgi:hypothetical protein